MTSGELFYYSVKIDFFHGDFERIRNISIGDGKTLLPQNVRLDAITLDVARGQLYYAFYSIKKDGSESSRRMFDEVALSRGEANGKVWIRHILPPSTPLAQRQALLEFWPQQS